MALVQAGVSPAFEKRWRELTEFATKIMLSKRKLRGGANIQRQGFQGVVTRISEDKLERVKRFAENNLLRRLLRERGMEEFEISKICGTLSEEDLVGVEDDLFDMANYCFIAILLLREKWEDNLEDAEIPF